MIVRTFKNGNAHIKREDETPATLEDFVSLVANCPEINCVTVRDFESWGNDYGAYPVEICGPAGQYAYQVTPGDLERFNSGRRVILQADRDYPLFDVPRYYDFYPVEIDGRRYMLYKLRTPLDQEDVERLEFYGCKVLQGRTEYAPEIRFQALAVPGGVSHWFE